MEVTLGKKQWKRIASYFDNDEFLVTGREWKWGNMESRRTDWVAAHFG